MASRIKFPERWQALRIAIVGGDEREQEISRLAVATGARVRVHGFPLPDDGIEGAVTAESAADALHEANVALFPIPGIAADGSIFATAEIVPDRALLGNMAPQAHIILGKADAALKGAAATLGIVLHEYESDQELMLLRAPAIVEGALQIAIANTDVTLHESRICVVGQGNIGKVLTRTLVVLGARVTVAARNAGQRAEAHTFGADAIDLPDLEMHAASADMIISTVPAPIVTAAIIDRLPPHALVMDLSAPPGGCDLDHARDIGLRAVWARALGRRAPITVGRSQWHGISKRINKILEES